MSDSGEENRIVRSKVRLGGSWRVEDAILPTEIHHCVDEFRGPDDLIQCYNYIVYQSERDGFSCTARTYLDAVDEVALLPSPGEAKNVNRVPRSAFRDDVLQYLKRRFHHIMELGEDGYVTVWRRSS